MTYVLVYSFPVAFAAVGWLALRSWDWFVDEGLAEFRRHRDYGSGAAASGSVEATLREVDGLPETPR